MKRKGPHAELQALRRFINDAERKFLLPHYRPSGLGTPSRDEELDVAAFVVLAHGAVENFIEGIGLWAVETVEQSWFAKRTSRSLVSLLLHGDVPESNYDFLVSVLHT